MRTVALTLAFLTFASRGQRIGGEVRSASQRSFDQDVKQMKALTTFLLAVNPNAARQTRAPPISMGLKIGDTFPTSALKSWGISGKNAVVFFYGADDAPSCKKEIAAFDKAQEQFAEKDVTLVGVRNAAGVKETTETAVPLVVDEDDAVRNEIGIGKDLFGFLGGRETYVVNKNGRVISVHNNQFDPQSHVNVALVAIETLPKKPKQLSFWQKIERDIFQIEPMDADEIRAMEEAE